MKILILTQVIFPFQSPRSYRSTELAKELARTGNQVTIYAIKGEYDYTEFENKHKIKVKNSIFIDKIKYI